MNKIIIVLIFVFHMFSFCVCDPIKENLEKTTKNDKEDQSFFISLGYASITGNAEAETGNLEFEHSFTYKKFQCVTTGKFIFTDLKDEDGIVTRKTEKYNAAIKSNYIIKNNKSFFGNVSYEKDKPSGIYNSLSLASGLDFTALFSKNHKIKTGFGLEAFSEEKIENDIFSTHDKIAGYMQVLYNVKLSENNFLKVENQSRIDFSDNDDYRITNNLSYLSHINKTLALKVIYNHDYKSMPVEGKEKVNTTTTVNLVFKF